jgi:hypothetical protein
MPGPIATTVLTANAASQEIRFIPLLRLDQVVRR